MGEVNGRRSNTWAVRGYGKEHNSFVSPRPSAAAMRFTLHKSGKWRMAYTAEHAVQLGLGGDRVLSRFDRPAEDAPGWRRGATVIIPESSLSDGIAADRPLKRGEAISWWPTSPPGWALRFDIMLRDAATDWGPTVNDAAGEVGRLNLANGWCVWIVATEIQVDEAHMLAIRDAVNTDARRRQVLPPLAGGPLSGMGWGPDSEGVATFYESGDVHLGSQ